MTGLFNRWFSVVLTAAMLLTGCGKDTVCENLPDEEELAGNLYIRFRMDLHESGIPGSTRAGSGATSEDETPDETPGTPHENAVNTVDLLVCDAADDKLIDHITLNKKQIEHITGSGLVVPVYVPKVQTLHIYAAVNMTDRMRQQFSLSKNGREVVLSSESNDYWSVIDEFVPGSAGRQETLENSDGGCIPMTGQFTHAGKNPTEIEISEAYATRDTLSVRADVSRIVAKIHVLAKGDEDGVYAHSMSGDESLGWIRLSDVRYMLNGTNKSTYLFLQPNAKESEYGWKDPNMDLESYLTGGMDLDLGFDAPAWANDYVFYSGMALHKENISAASHLAQAEAFDQATFDNTTSGAAAGKRYTRGMYCLENYFDTPTVNAATFAAYEEAIPMITHVSVAARLTPRWIVIVADYAEKMEKFIKNYKDKKEEFLAAYGLTTDDFTDGDVARWSEIKAAYNLYFTTDDYLYRDRFRFIRTENEADADDIINWSLKVNNLWSPNPDDFEHDKYPSGTFYVYDMKYDAQAAVPSDLVWKHEYLYLSAGAVAAAKTDNIDIKTYSVPHLGGWGYYYTYLDQPYPDQLGKTAGGKTPYTASQVTRNTYYLITINNFGMAGGSISRPEYIRVNTEPVGWDYDGKGDINLY